MYKIKENCFVTSTGDMGKNQINANNSPYGKMNYYVASGLYNKKSDVSNCKDNIQSPKVSSGVFRNIKNGKTFFIFYFR